MATDWAAVYRETYADLVRFLHRKVWDADRARDLAQEVFVRALDHEPDKPRAFVFTIAANLARDEARGAAVRKRHLELVKADPERGLAPDPAEEMDARDRMASVQAALGRLSDRDRDVLLLWDAGLSYDEIATQTGLARSAVGTTLARARRRLIAAHEAVEGSNAALG